MKLYLLLTGTIDSGKYNNTGNLITDINERLPSPDTSPKHRSLILFLSKTLTIPLIRRNSLTLLRSIISVSSLFTEKFAGKKPSKKEKALEMPI